MQPYQVLVSIKILQIPRLSRDERERILSFLESLSKNPYRTGDYEEYDEIGRPVQIKIIGSFALTFWVDHAVKEVKVVHIAKADPD